MDSFGVVLGTQKPHKHKLLWGYPYLIGLHYKGVYMGYPYPYFCLCAFWGPYCNPSAPSQVASAKTERVLGWRLWRFCSLRQAVIRCYLTKKRLKSRRLTALGFVIMFLWPMLAKCGSSCVRVDQQGAGDYRFCQASGYAELPSNVCVSVLFSTSLKSLLTKSPCP